MESMIIDNEFHLVNRPVEAACLAPRLHECEHVRTCTCSQIVCGQTDCSRSHAAKCGRRNRVRAPLIRGRRLEF